MPKNSVNVVINSPALIEIMASTDLSVKGYAYIEDCSVIEYPDSVQYDWLLFDDNNIAIPSFTSKSKNPAEFLLLKY